METEKCSHLLKGMDPSRLLKKALALLEHQVTKEDVNRQLKTINQYLIISSKGFLVRDLSNIMQLFELVRLRSYTEAAFEETLNKLLDLCSIPPVLTRSLELVAFAMDLQEYFSWLGYMIVWHTSKEHQMKIIGAIHALLTQRSLEKCYISLDIRKFKARESKLADLLRDLLEIVEDSVYLEVLKVMEVLIDGSKQTYIAMLAMSRDIVFHPNWMSHIKLTTSHEDQNCMALLLMCISYFPNCLSGSKVLEECRVVMGLMKLIGHQQAIKWHQLQACYLIRLSLNILYKIIPASPEEFVEDGGPSVILQLLNDARENRDLYSYDIIFRSLELLSHLSYKFKSIRDSVAYNGGVNCILHLCKVLLEPPYILEEYQLLVAVCFCLLEQISNVDDASEVLPVVISYMKRYVNPGEREQIQIPKLIITCLNFVWNKIALSGVNGEKFVKMGGVYLMLDIAQIGCLPVKLITLGALIDLCENVECIPYLITWRRNGQAIKGLLMEIFRQENKQLKVKSNDNGIISDHLYPLMGEDQYYETYCMCRKHVGNSAIADMFVSCRPKVYCLLQILNFKQNETVEIANEFYKIDCEESVIDKITCVLAENFLAIKLSEEWKEIRQEFKKMELEPIPEDASTLKAMADIAKKWGKDLQKMQQDILNKYHSKESKKEQSLYTKLRNSHLSEAWDSLCEMKYVARCSERLFRVTSSFNLQSQISKSLVIDEHNGQMHHTFQSNLSITCMHNQTINIPNEFCEDLLAAEKPVIVSPIPSKMGTPRDVFDDPKGEYLPEDLLAYSENETGNCSSTFDTSQGSPTKHCIKK